MDLILFVVTFVTLLFAGYFYVKKKLRYWEEKDVPFVKPKFPFGILSDMATQHISKALTAAYTELKGKDEFGGIYFFLKPTVLITNLDILKNILVKDFQYFHDRGLYANEKDDPLSGHLFALSGQKWKTMRNKLTPTFTSGKMKMMHSTIIAVAKEFQNYLEPIAQANEEIEFKDILARFTTDVIGNCAFGIECNSIKDPDTEFRRIGVKVFQFTNFEMLRIFILSFFQGLGRILKLKVNKPDVSEFFMRILRETIEYREQNNVNRNDFLSLLMQLKNSGKLEGNDTSLGKITFEELAAQTFIFFAAGYETSSSTMTFALYELAQNQDIQDNVREEVNRVLAKYNGEYSYEACMDMKYLDQVINETLRKYPIVDGLIRVCGQDYQVPGTAHVIEKDTLVLIPVFAFHRDPDIYPEPEKFDPDRFTHENVKNRHPYAWMPFGEGPRNCVGMRFGMMQTRVGLAHLLQKYRIKTSPNTPNPIIFDPRSTVLSPIEGMCLNILTILTNVCNVVQCTWKYTPIRMYLYALVRHTFDFTAYGFYLLPQASVYIKEISKYACSIHRAAAVAISRKLANKMDLTTLLLGFVTLILVGYFYVKYQYQYWGKRGVPYVKPTFPLGNLWGVGTSKHISQLLQDQYRELKGKDVFGGMYFMANPTAIALDLDFLKNILVKDFQYFHDRGVYVNERDDPLSGHLFSLSGQKWKVMRTKLSPTFTSGKMKMMHNTIIAVAEEFEKFLEPSASKNEEIEFKEILARFSTDVIGNCAFGIECNSFKDPNSEFRRVGRKVFDFSGLGLVKQFFVHLFPKIALALRMEITDKDVTKFFLKLLKDTIDYRESSNVKRNDFLSLMIQLKNTGRLEGDNVDLGKLTFEELAAQTFVFFVAGFETSSSTMTFALYELALHQELQDRAREEIKTVLEKHGGKFTYEACMELKYLETIIHETLRKYPIVDNLIRIATNDYPVPETNHVIKKGMSVIIPVYALQRDPEIYPNPERFDPDRFSEENMKDRNQFSWLPFGEGPRICVGMRFGMMQTRVGLATILNKYRINVTQKTPIPMTLSPTAAFLSPEGGMWLRIEKL
ncbi:uncharacterized protein LOC132257759 [Phlebotomus argentipes]|uniref:uncharacterized protein LOC132257759 n=1 Tax=Phlebotomus argentipes TaxID=94469 RepID=UPI002892E67A|nr:uncharacterized protein LOC132257759 [Phlebotomus argentipes]